MLYSSHHHRSVRCNFCLSTGLQICVFLMLLCHGASFAEDASETMPYDFTQQDSLDMETADDETAGDSGSGTLRMVVSLLVVLSLIFAGVFLLKKVGPYSGIIGSQAQAKHPMMVLSRLSLGQRRSVCLVRVGDEILVIGVTNANMSLLSKISAEEYYREGDSAHGNLAGAGSQTSKYGGNFKSFRKILEKLGAWNGKTSDAP